MRYPGYLAHVVSGMFYSVVDNRRQPNLYIYNRGAAEGVEASVNRENHGKIASVLHYTAHRT